jgi:hypothetical protein
MLRFHITRHHQRGRVVGVVVPGVRAVAGIAILARRFHPLLLGVCCVFATRVWVVGVIIVVYKCIVGPDLGL